MISKRKRKSSATFHRLAESLHTESERSATSDETDDGVVYGLEDEDTTAGMVNPRALWYRGKMHHRESMVLRSQLNIDNGDFFIRSVLSMRGYV